MTYDDDLYFTFPTEQELISIKDELERGVRTSVVLEDYAIVDLLGLDEALKSSMIVSLHIRDTVFKYDTLLSKIICAARQIESLVELDLSNIKIPHNAITEIVELILIGKLQSIHIFNCQMDDSEMVKIVKAMAKINSLLRINLFLRRYCIDNEICHYYAEVIRSNYNLQIIQIYNNFGDAILEIAEAISVHESINCVSLHYKSLEPDAYNCMIKKFIEIINDNYTLNILDITNNCNQHNQNRHLQELQSILNRNIECYQQKRFKKMKSAIY